MRTKLQTAAGRAVYARRKTIPEPVFGQIKQGRGFRCFWLRGVGKVRGERGLIWLTHNLLNLFRARTRPGLTLCPRASGPGRIEREPPSRNLRLGWPPSRKERDCWLSRFRFPLPRQAPRAA